MSPLHTLRIPELDSLPIEGLPGVIRVPGVAADPTSARAIEKPLIDATVSDLDAHLACLEAEITANSRRHQALTELRDRALAGGATPETLVCPAVFTHPVEGA